MNNIVKDIYGSALDPKKLLGKFSQMESKKMPWRTKWQKIIDATYPSFRDFTDKTSSPNTYKIANHCSAISGKITKAINVIHGQITDPMVKWLGLKPRKIPVRLLDGQAIMLYDNPHILQWLQFCEEVLYDLFADPKSNFYPSTNIFHKDWFTIGTACRHVTLRRDTGDIYFNCISMEDMFIDVGPYDNIDTVSRKYSLTSEQAFKLWGENAGENVIQTLQSGNDGKVSQRKFDFIEMCIETPKELQGNKFAVAPFLSVVINKSTKTIVDILPEQSLPYIVARFDIDAGDMYGKSLVWMSMPDITILNRNSKNNIQAIEYAQTPALLVHDALSVNINQLSPASLIQGLDSEKRPEIQPLNMGANIPLAMQFYEQKMQELDEQLLAKEIIPAETVGSMSPQELAERRLQWSTQTRPMILRLEHEDLMHTVKRTLQLLHIKGELPQFPYDALGLPPELLPDPLSMVNVYFAGQMVKIQKAQDINDLDILIAKVGQYAQLDPSVVGLLKIPDIIKEEADIYNIKKELIKSDEELQAEAEAQMMAQMQQAEQEQRQTNMQEALMNKQLENQGISYDDEGDEF